MTHRTRRALMIGLMATLAASGLDASRATAAGKQSGETVTITKCPEGTVGISVEDGCEACPLGYTSDEFRERCIEDSTGGRLRHPDRAGTPRPSGRHHDDDLRGRL